MNVNKKLDRFKQWAGERMGGEVKTSVSDDFKAMEIEMGLRQEGTLIFQTCGSHKDERFTNTLQDWIECKGQ